MQTSASPSATDLSALDASPSNVAGAASVSEFGIRGQYQDPNSAQTLREGLAEYYRVNPGLSDPADIKDPKSAMWFRNHDCTHVVFGTHTGPLDEAANDMLTMFGVEIRFRDYLRGFFATDESKSVTKSYASVSLLAHMTWWTLRLLPKLWRTSRNMSHKWPWHPSEALMDRPLCVLRAQYNIEVFRPEVVLGLKRA